MHKFNGSWITDEEFYRLESRNVFHKQLKPIPLPCDQHRNRHILFRKSFSVANAFKSGKIYISADDYYKLYINGKFVAQGPCMSYHFRHNYNVVDIADYIHTGENTLAVHTYYQGIINRVWQSGDNRHGLILDLEIDGKNVVKSDQSFKTHPHSGYTEIGVTGINTQFLEEYDSRSREVGFEKCDYDDSHWEFARLHEAEDHTLTEQKTKMLELEEILPQKVEKNGNKVFIDFGKIYMGYLRLTARGKSGSRVIIRCGHELNADDSVRFELRCNCKYEEPWILRDGDSTLDWFDYKALRYAEIILPAGAELSDISLTARHYPFRLQASLKKEYQGNEDLEKIWELCVNTQKYGVQEAILDCMDREKGFYIGDVGYAALTHYILTGDDSVLRMQIDSAFTTSFVTDTLLNCLNCSHMQEIAEMPLMLISLLLWYYKISGNKEYLREHFQNCVRVLESYRAEYEHNFLLSRLDKWCVVEWPMNYRDGYDVEIAEGSVCQQAHISINAYYIDAIKAINEIADILGEESYRDPAPLYKAFIDTFYVDSEKLFRDGEETHHISIVGNIFPFAFDLCPNKECEEKITALLRQKKISYVSIFCAFLAMMKMVKLGREDLLREALLDGDAWLKMLREGATATFEGWGKDSKKNISLFHMTLSYAALFMADIDLKKIFSQEKKND